jgi:hypothetical protein
LIECAANTKRQLTPDLIVSVISARWNFVGSHHTFWFSVLVRLAAFIGRISDSPTATLAAVVLFTIAFGLLDYLADLTMQQLRVPEEFHAATQAAVVGVGTGLAALLYLRALGERRKAIRDELRRVIELNHNVRNALQAIAYAHQTDAKERHEMIVDSVDRIARTLRELFPAIDMDKKGEPRPGGRRS